MGTLQSSPPSSTEPHISVQHFSSSSLPSLQGVLSAVFSERCELRKGLAVLDAQKRPLNWKIRSKENYISRVESLGVGPEKRDQVGTSGHPSCPCVDPPAGAVRPTRWSEPTCSGSTSVGWSSHRGLQGPSPAPPPDRPSPG